MIETGQIDDLPEVFQTLFRIASRKCFDYVVEGCPINAKVLDPENMIDILVTTAEPDRAIWSLLAWDLNDKPVIGMEIGRLPPNSPRQGLAEQSPQDYLDKLTSLDSDKRTTSTLSIVCVNFTILTINEAEEVWLVPHPEDEKDKESVYFGVCLKSDPTKEYYLQLHSAPFLNTERYWLPSELH